MSARRSRSSRISNSNSAMNKDQMSELVSMLRHLIPELRRCRADKISSSKVLQETCNYIRSLHKEMDDLSDKLAQLLECNDTDTDQADIIRGLLML